MLTYVDMGEYVRQNGSIVSHQARYATPLSTVN